MSNGASKNTFGKDNNLLSEVVTTGRKVCAGREFYSRLAHDKYFFRKMVMLQDGTMSLPRNLFIVPVTGDPYFPVEQLVKRFLDVRKKVSTQGRLEEERFDTSTRQSCDDTFLFKDLDLSKIVLLDVEHRRSVDWSQYFILNGNHLLDIMEHYIEYRSLPLVWPTTCGGYHEISTFSTLHFNGQTIVGASDGLKHHAGKVLNFVLKFSPDRLYYPDVDVAGDYKGDSNWIVLMEK